MVIVTESEAIVRGKAVEPVITKWEPLLKDSSERVTEL